MYCRDCQYWRKLKEEEFGDCSNNHFIYDDVCGKTPQDGLGYTDYEGYSAQFWTGPDFGCIHFEPREP